MMGEKTEPPSPRRLAEARQKGQLPRSKLMSSAAVTAGGVAAALASAPESAARLREWTTSLLAVPKLDPSAAIDQGLRVIALTAAPVLIGAFAAAAAVSLVAAGFKLTVEAVLPQLERVDPFAGLSRLVSFKVLVEVGKALAVAGLVSLLVWGAVERAAPAVLRAVSLEGAGSLVVVFDLVAQLVKQCCGAILLLGVADYLYARHQHLKDLMMTREEAKQEHKSSEGDPREKAKRKAAHRQLSLRGPARGLKDATAVVVNPTHLAIALRYREGETDAPYIMAKGREDDALTLRQAAERAGVPVMQDIPLARALIHYDVGEEIPEELYQAVAAILKVAFDKTERARVTPEIGWVERGSRPALGRRDQAKRDQPSRCLGLVPRGHDQ